MKAKIVVDLPDRARLLAGLEPRELHKPLVRAEEQLADAERELEHKRQKLAELERVVAELPARVHRGEVRADALTDGLRARDAAALVIEPAQAEVTKRRERVAVETKNATAARDREIAKRFEVLERLIGELSPVLNELRELSIALAKADDPQAWPTLSWPSSPADDAIAWSNARSGQ